MNPQSPAQKNVETCVETSKHGMTFGSSCSLISAISCVTLAWTLRPGHRSKPMCGSCCWPWRQSCVAWPTISQPGQVVAAKPLDPTFLRRRKVDVEKWPWPASHHPGVSLKQQSAPTGPGRIVFICYLCCIGSTSQSPKTCNGSKKQKIGHHALSETGTLYQPFGCFDTLK